MGGPESGNFSLLYVVKCPYVGGWVLQKSLKTPLRNIKMAPYIGSVTSVVEFCRRGSTGASF